MDCTAFVWPAFGSRATAALASVGADETSPISSTVNFRQLQDGPIAGQGWAYQGWRDDAFRRGKMLLCNIDCSWRGLRTCERKVLQTSRSGQKVGQGVLPQLRLPCRPRRARLLQCLPKCVLGLTPACSGTEISKGHSRVPREVRRVATAFTFRTDSSMM